MDPVELIVAALATGAAGGAENVASAAVKDAYQELKQLVSLRFAGKKTAKIAMAEHETDPEAGRAPLMEALADTGADTDREVIAAAQRLLAMLDAPRNIGAKYAVTVSDSQGIQVGDGGFQTNHFPTHDPAS
jgi:hypothetical protein